MRLYVAPKTSGRVLVDVPIKYLWHSFMGSRHIVECR